MTSKKILIVKPSSLGDVVHSLPFLSAMKRCFPQSEIHWVISKGLEGLLEDHPMIDRLIIINKDLWKKIAHTGATLKEIEVLYKQLRREKYDLVVDLQGLLRSGLITWATHAPLRIGFHEAREGSRFFYTKKVRGGNNIHAVDRYLKIAEALGCDTHEILFPFSDSHLADGVTKEFICKTPSPSPSEGEGNTTAPPLRGGSPQATRRGEDEGEGGSGLTNDSLRKDPDPYVVLVPGARWKTKIWPAESFGKVASMLPLGSVIVGGTADRALADEVASYSDAKAVSMAGETGLKELIDIMRKAALVITNDSGPMHIAAALNVPVVAIFGPTSPDRTGPYGAGHIVLQSEAGCVPCFKRECSYNLQCMKEITPEAVCQAVLEVLRRKES